MQSELDFTPLLPEEKGTSIYSRFKKFHANNPHVYENLVRMAREFRRKGSNHNRKLGIGMLYEVLRWNYYLSTEGEEEFKLSNDFRAVYARKIMENEPDLSDAFNTKQSVVDTE
jgi:hypothetical protein